MTGLENSPTKKYQVPTYWTASRHLIRCTGWSANQGVQFSCMKNPDHHFSMYSLMNQIDEVFPRGQSN